ncbi:molybdenum cofactor biosynthesis protein MoeA [Microbacterium sp. CH12i]|uniref:GTP 3',8-cyclase MoaA n=1 Tax=Microbacterium sp. CH12i TaxID=1479651 RepID=UPI000461D88B|nr:GTP 3',8-cyclase MoaA [Microbacterium sp. CH12i]KDA06811.1 molybdenum cofactor biosynthesis protein MoeA [Microbacterium sp. CH12i]
MSITPAAEHRAPGASRLPSTGSLIDRLDRPLRDLRISVTDRCNFRCVYCMPRAVFGRDYAFLSRDELLSFEEIERISRIAVAHGVRKLRLTGGEPLLRRGIEELIARLAALRTPEGNRVELALTTNGSALTVKAQALKDAGLDRLTVSVDSLDDELFQRMNDVRFPVSRVLDGIDAAHAVGIGPIKLNMVVKRGLNDGEIEAMATRFKGTPYTLRFIEYMDVGTSNGWSLDEVVPSSEIVERISALYPLEPVGPASPGETAKRWRYSDGTGEIGLISSVTNTFCGTCNRARISTEGKLFTCLFATEGHDLRALLRGGADDEELSAAMASIWGARDDRYSEIRSELTPELRASRKRIEMSYIGG